MICIVFWWQPDFPQFSPTTSPFNCVLHSTELCKFSFILSRFFDAWKGLVNIVLTFLICLIFAEYESDLRQFSYHIKWMSCWIMKASFFSCIVSGFTFQFFFSTEFKDCWLCWFLSLKSSDFIVLMLFDPEYVTSITGISFLNFIYLTLTSTTLRKAIDPLHRTTKKLCMRDVSNKIIFILLLLSRL